MQISTRRWGVGLTAVAVESADRERRGLRLLVPSGECSSSATVAVPKEMRVGDEADVQIVTPGRMQFNGPPELRTQLDVGCLSASGAVSVGRAATTPVTPA
ncbi:hypothetical protein EBM89_13470 [Cellulomonas triticagri]|uniref:Uncharacterized protein n=1 Tax=Cellulomonas triticagri TaxID=2483352 RepID=A0A3M2J3K0_9CELL|nr:hypothetical protein EBM89_13470 [Cellulomonas triticagri]